jgi:endonuclease/exonuclease/phosphatase (EEP) superfamily protein YafD
VRSLVAIAVAAPWVVWALLRTAGLDGPYPFVGALAYTAYVALCSPLPVLVAVVLRRRLVAAVAGVAAVALAIAVVPRALAGPNGPGGGPRLVVMTFNAYVGHADAPAVLRIAGRHRVDVLSLQELTPQLVARLDGAGARQQFAGRAVDPRPGASGSGLLARRPLRPLPATSGNGPHAEPEAELDVPGAPPVRIKAVHPPPPVSRSATPVWSRVLRALPGSDGRGDVQVLAGDFNATLDHRQLREVLDRGYVDAADAVGAGFAWTWPARDHAHTLAITIDHVLVDRRVKVRRVTAVGVPGSDHRAVIAELELPAG